MLVTIALLVAAHVVLSRFLSINAWNIKIGFAFVAVFVGAYIYGPVAGALVGGLGDIVGASLFPIGAYFPGFTLNCALTGVIFGVLLYKKQSKPKIVIAVLLDQLLVSMWLTPLWISFLYGAKYIPVVFSRLPQIAVMVAVQLAVIFVLIGLLERVKLKNIVSVPEKVKDERREIRREKIAEREALSVEERREKSCAIVDKIVKLPEYLSAKNILIYSAIRGEVDLGSLEDKVRYTEKKLYYPLVVSATEMYALHPESEDAWQEGFHNIKEPIKEKSSKLDAEEFDLVICPCTAFDEDLGRMGMGAGYYDRFLERCTSARIIAVAFECQKVPSVLPQEWDRPMDMIITEEREYCKP